VRNTPPATSGTALAKALRTAQGDALPASTVTMLAQLASEMARLSSVQALASVRAPANAAVLDAVARISKPLYELPEVTRMIRHIPTRLTAIDVARSASLSSTIASMMPASSMRGVLATLDLGGTNAAFAAQLSQLFSEHDALVQIASTTAARTARQPLLDTVKAVNAAGFGAQTSLVAAQAAQIVSAQDSLARLMATTSVNASMAGLFGSLTRYGQVQAHLGAFAVDVGAPVMLRGYSRLAGRRYDSYLDGLPARPIAKRATVARLGGDAQTGLLVAEALTSDIDDDERDDLTERFSVVSLEAWETGPAAARQELFAALDEVAPGLADWLKAAWENIERDGYKAASIIANSTVECIDRTLRVLAPVEAVTAWVTEAGPPKGWLDTKTGLPTRATKIRYAMRNRSKRDARLAVDQVEALATLVQGLVGNLQNVKHAEATTIVVMRNWVQTTEAALSQLLLGL